VGGFEFTPYANLLTILPSPRPSLGLLIERWLPWISSCLVFVGVWFFPNLWLFKADWKGELLTNVIAASAILAAYLLTAATILPAVEEKATVQKLRSWKYYTFIVDYIGRAAKAAALLLVLSLIAIPLPKVVLATHTLKDHVDLINQIFSALWWSLAVLSIGFVYVATRILLKLLRAR
jgi:hypothetical protein